MSSKFIYAKLKLNEKGKKSPDFGQIWGTMTRREADTKCQLTGKEFGTTVVDVDSDDVDPKLLELLGDPTYKTARGYHWHFDYEPDIRQTQGLFPGVDIRNDGGLVFIKYWGDIESISYEKIGEQQVMSSELRDMLIAASHTRTKNNTEKYTDAVATGEPWGKIPEGEQHEGLRILCQEAFKRGLSYDQVEAKHLAYLDDYLERTAHELGLMRGRVDWASELFERGGSLEGDTLEPSPVLAVEVVEGFELDDTYKGSIARLARITESEVAADAIKQIKGRFGVSMPDIRKDVIEEQQLNSKESFLYPDYEFTAQGELKYQATRKNLKVLFKRMGIKPYYDVITKEVVVVGRKMRGDNSVSVLRSDVMSEAIRTGLPPTVVDWHYNEFMMEKEKNPLLKAVRSVKWDGKDHLKKLSKCIHVKGDKKYAREGLKRWMIQCVAAWDTATRSPRKDKVAKYEMILVMQSAQGVKKTSFFGKLLPGKLNKYFYEGASLHTANKDSVMTLLGHGIVELGEIDATFKKSDISEIKSFTSMRVDKIRPPYGRDILVKPRRTSMCSSVNDAQFLNDVSGARRFFVMALKRLDSIDHVDMMQVWAQVWDLYTSGSKWWFDADEKWVKVRDVENEDHRESGMSGEIVIELMQMLLDGHIIPSKIGGMKLFELVTGRAPNNLEVINFGKELLKSGAHRNTAKQYSKLLDWARSYKEALNI